MQRGTLRAHALFASALGAAVALGGASCSSGSPAAPTSATVGDDGGASGDDGGGGQMGAPFAPVPASVYVAKVKDLLVGLPPTDDEVKAVTADPGALRGLVDQWMARPEFVDKIEAFFRNAFQQSQIALADFADQLPINTAYNPQASGRLMANVRDSFARTVWQLVTEDRPLHEAITTRRFMMTPALMSLYALLDIEHVDDTGKRVDRVVQANPQFTFTVSAASGPIPLAQTLDPQSPQYMHWYNPAIGSATLDPACRQDPRVYVKEPSSLFSLLYGGLSRMAPSCNTVVTPTLQMADTDFSQWKMITVRPPKPGEATTNFWDLLALRNATELVLHVPRIGFFSTPAFFANWPTNSSNQGRVTMNQTLIVALGKAFDDTNSITPVSETSLDGMHADPSTPCYACHKTLDPMRQFFRQAYTLAYHDQTDPAQTSVNGVFAFGGVTQQGTGIGDLATMLASHPRFAQAWVQKLCYYATSAACADDDPELARIVGVFQQASFSFKALVRELFTSPLVTQAADTQTFQQQGVTVPIARRDHLCVALSERLGIADVCGVGGEPTLTAAQKAAQQIATALPADGYSRGAEAPVLANDPTLFFRAGMENLCRIVADQIVDVKGTSKYTSAKSDDAIADFVTTIMALPPSDARAPGARAVLSDHFKNAQASGASPTDALKSTFVLACLAPSNVGLGM